MPIQLDPAVAEPLNTQVNEEDLFRRLLDRVKAAEDSRWYLLALDQELSQQNGA